MTEVATRVSSMITLDLKERFVLLIAIQMEMGNSNLMFRFKLIFDMFITIIIDNDAARHTAHA